MTTRRWTILILTVAVLGLIGWDIYVALTPQKGDTISEILLELSGKISLVPAGLGFLMGHLFWPKKEAKFSLVGTLSTAAAFGLRDVVAYFWAAIAVAWWPIVALCIAIPLGHAFWPQKARD